MPRTAAGAGTAPDVDSYAVARTRVRRWLTFWLRRKEQRLASSARARRLAPREIAELAAVRAELRMRSRAVGVG
jgi:hypothetical protein